MLRLHNGRWLNAAFFAAIAWLGVTLRKTHLDMSRLAGGAFRDGQFRLFFLGIFFAVQAIWVQRVTLGWLAWERTGSAGFVGLVAGLSLAPALVLGPVFGVIADRVDIRRASLTTNGAMAAVLATLALAHCHGPAQGRWLPPPERSVSFRRPITRCGCRSARGSSRPGWCNTWSASRRSTSTSRG
jgi:hypothetical protein